MAPGKGSISSTFYTRVFAAKISYESCILGKFLAPKILYKKRALQTLMKLTKGFYPSLLHLSVKTKIKIILHRLYIDVKYA